MFLGACFLDDLEFFELALDDFFEDCLEERFDEFFKDDRHDFLLCAELLTEDFLLLPAEVPRFPNFVLTPPLLEVREACETADLYDLVELAREFELSFTNGFVLSVSTASMPYVFATVGFRSNNFASAVFSEICVGFLGLF